jgi:hypothetical protein
MNRNENFLKNYYNSHLKTKLQTNNTKRVLNIEKNEEDQGFTTDWKSFSFSSSPSYSLPMCSIESTTASIDESYKIDFCYGFDESPDILLEASSLSDVISSCEVSPFNDIEIQLSNRIIQNIRKEIQCQNKK